jgi:transcriptional regulator with XRE-family HTH domain
VTASSDSDRTLHPSRLREWRTVRGVSQRQLAALSGVARQTILRTELGRTMPTPGTLVCLAAALKVQPADLLGHPNPPQGASA